MTRAAITLLAVALTCAACQQSPPPAKAVVNTTAQQQLLKQQFAKQQQDWRSERLAKLTKPDGWASLIGLDVLDPGAHRLGSAADSGIRLAMGPKHLGILTVKKNALSFAPERGVEVKVDDVPVRGMATLHDDTNPDGPSRITFDDGKGVATVIVRAGGYRLRTKHADADTRMHFAGLDYWPGGTDWQVKAHFIANPAGKTMQIANIIGSTDEMANPGVLEFQHAGKTFRLQALDEGEGTLFLVFADRTSGHGSYGAGRFIDAPMPDAQGNVVIDFNQAYNPPCAFTPFATCPLPPLENRLDLPVEAGEKAYAKSAH
ncbi:MAG: DUF1684 domain-containing protein [Thermomonas sp.]